MNDITEAEQHPAGASISDLTFLIAEDHEFQRSALKWMLTGLGATMIHEAGDGLAALRILQRADVRVDIIISDLDMPGMDGMAFVRHLGERGIQSSIIIASALDPKLLASIATMAESYGTRVLGTIEKPLTPDKLLRLIERHDTAPQRKRSNGPTFTIDELVQGLADDEFEPFFQPKVELLTGNVRGAEALARWRHPVHGIVSPHAFIGLFEEAGRIDELTWVILRKAASACRIWRAKGIDADVSVNLSIRSVSAIGFAERVAQEVKRQALDPSHMMLEITETAATLEVAHALENLGRLRMQGFGLSIDDYGTGYATMQQLTRIPYTELKIDRSFVAETLRQESARIILESSLEMARRLRLVSVAEGVDSHELVELLRELHCDQGQGFFIAAPMSEEEWMQWAGDR
jgi:EAL domain-containing protein (putative c-di-GMP-specific phosphodiesterase class I)/CheY-like chemotaxis protein